MAFSSLQSTLSSVSSPDIDEHQWVINIRKSIDQEGHRKCEDTPVSIFIVPKTLMVDEPSCYIPQHVALGPIHYWRPELLDMAVYKIAAAGRLQKNLRNYKNFDGLVDRFTELEPVIRACYQRFIKYDGRTLALMMAVDAAFLLEFLQIYSMSEEGKMLSQPPSTISQAQSNIVITPELPKEAMEEERMLPRARLMHSHVHDYAGTRHALNAIIRDIMMLENQIPLFVLRETLEAQCASPIKEEIQSSLAEEAANNELNSMLKGFFKEVCPFKFIVDVDDFPNIQVAKRTHLLDCMYHMIQPEAEESSSDDYETESDVSGSLSEKEKKISYKNGSKIIELLKRIQNLLSGVAHLPKPLRSILKSITFVTKLPWDNLLNKQKNEGSSSGAPNDFHKPPEIAIPSASELLRSGVSFYPITKGKFASISFDSKKATFNLPTISLDENTEVVLRNLVAYEASFIKSGPLYFTRYTELMNGIIDSAEDVKILKARKVILNHLKSDEEVVKLWNGMSRSIRTTHVPNLDPEIENVNTFYKRRWMIKVEKYMRRYVYESWQFLTFLAVVLLLLFEMFEAFCSVYNCNTLFHFKYPAQ